MKTLTIYSKGEKGIDRYKAFVYEKTLLNLLDKTEKVFDENKEKKTMHETISSSFILEELARTDGTPEEEKKIFNILTKGQILPNVSEIIIDILYGNTKEASYAMNKLFEYPYKNEKECQMLLDIISCFKFKEDAKKLDLKKLLFKLEATLKNEESKNKYVDDKTLEAKKLPSSYVLNAKHE